VRYARDMKPFFAGVTLLLAAAAACSSPSEPKEAKRVSASEARSLLLDRNWIDQMPKTHRDRLHVFRFVPTMGGGVFQDRTLFRGTFELFTFENTGSEIRFHLPETGEKVRAAYTIETIDGPAPFDLRLSIPESPRGPKVYYGVRAETDRSGAALEARLQTAGE
jgi:hypothetical protein